MNPTTTRRYAQNRLRVARQVYYSENKTDSIDLVFFVNGLPVATAELKSEFQQDVHEAIRQYRHDRPPVDPKTRRREPLLTPGHRALVHFAVDNSEVYMTTRLDGPETRFLPFNRGNAGHAGNPPNPHGAATAYLWEEVLAKDTWLNILGKFMHVQVSKHKDPATGKVSRSSTVIFPRYHQHDAVTTLPRASAFLPSVRVAVCSGRGCRDAGKIARPCAGHLAQLSSSGRVPQDSRPVIGASHGPSNWAPDSPDGARKGTAQDALRAGADPAGSCRIRLAPHPEVIRPPDAASCG